MNTPTKPASKYGGFQQSSGYYIPARGATIKRLPSGAYSILVNPNDGSILLETIVLTSDNIIDLPSPEYKRVTEEMETFLQKEDAFRNFGFLYKRSSLLHGKPGTGKTVIVQRAARNVIDQGGIVLFNPPPSKLTELFDQINDTSPDAMVLVIFEELEQFIAADESRMLSILDGEIQKDRVIYMATTNYLDMIPPRLLRPGRFSSVIEVHYPNGDSRFKYLQTKLEPKDLSAWALATDGLSIDELKECILAVKIFGRDLLSTVDELIKVRESAENAVREQAKMMSNHICDEDDLIRSRGGYRRT